MRKTGIQFHPHLALVVAIAWLTAPLSAQECSNEDFSGRYAVQQHNTILGGTQGNWVAGTLVADGEGLITEWQDTFVLSIVTPDDMEQKILLERDIVGDAIGPVTYEVTSDCRITIQLLTSTRPPGDQEIEMRGALAYGGSEVLATLVLPTAAKEGIVMKSVKPWPGRSHRGHRGRGDNDDDDDD